MYAENAKQISVRAAMTPEQAMELIRHIAAHGTEATHLDIRMTRYTDDDASLFISINDGFGTLLDVQAEMVVI